jgi:hypothetical protein
MKDTIYRQDAIDTFLTIGSYFVYGEDVCKAVASRLKELPSAESEIIRCKYCIHKPRYRYPDDLINNDGFDIIFPDSICPCQCDDGWYNWMPKDNFYCARAERRTDE